MHLKILTVVYSLAKGGTQRVAQNFASAYAKLGNDSRVLFTSEGGIRKFVLEQIDIPVYSLSDSSHLDLICDWNPGLVHLHSHGLSTSDVDLIRFLLPSATLIETNVFSTPSPWIRHIEKSYQLSYWCQWLYKSRLLAPAPFSIIPNAVDTDSFEFVGNSRVVSFRSFHKISSEDQVIGRVGQSYDGKWSPQLITVFERLKKKHPKLKLLLVNLPPSLLAKARMSPYFVDIIVIDQLSDDSSLNDCYSSIDVFVHIAEQGESFGMVLAESLLCRTPVVTLATPWCDNSQGEVVGNGLGGYVAVNINALVEYVHLLLINPELRSHLGRSGRNRIVELYDSRKVASSVLNSISFMPELIDTRVAAPSLDKIPSPFELMRNTQGRLGFFSKLVLLSNKRFWLLKYTTGYERSFKLVPILLNFVARRLFRLL